MVEVGAGSRGAQCILWSRVGAVYAAESAGWGGGLQYAALSGGGPTLHCSNHGIHASCLPSSQEEDASAACILRVGGVLGSICSTGCHNRTPSGIKIPLHSPPVCTPLIPPCSGPHPIRAPPTHIPALTLPPHHPGPLLHPQRWTLHSASAWATLCWPWSPPPCPAWPPSS